VILCEQDNITTIITNSIHLLMDPVQATGEGEAIAHNVEVMNGMYNNAK
jgi:hypothetical protein